MILALYLPYFAAMSLRRANRIAPDVPIAVAHRSKINATCQQASASGVRIGLTVRQAKAILPDLVVLEDDPGARVQVMRELLEVLAEYTPQIEGHTDSLYTGRKKLKLRPDPQQAAVLYVDFERLRAADVYTLSCQMAETVFEATGIRPELGIASGKFPAYGAAHLAIQLGKSGEPVLIQPGHEAELLALLPITLLPLDDEMYRRLVSLGLVTLGQVAALPQEGMVMQFGAHGFLLHRLAHGRDDRPVIPYDAAHSIQVSRECEEPLGDMQLVEALLRSMATDLSAQLQATKQMGRTLVLRVRFADHTVCERQMMLRQPVSSAAHLFPKLTVLLTRLLPVEQGIVALDVKFHDLMPLAGEQLDLFVHQTIQRERLTDTLTRLSARYSPKQFLWIRPLDPTARRIEQRYRLRSLDEV